MTEKPSKDNEILSELFNEETQVPANDQLFSQYKLYVEMADKISSRRAIANAFFLTVNAILVGSMGIFVENNKLYLVILPLLSGLIFSLFWYQLIFQYKHLNSAKFKIINKIEEKLPAKGFSIEWKLLEQGEEKKVYWPLTNLERLVPGSLSFIYVILIILIFAALVQSPNLLGLTGN